MRTDSRLTPHASRLTIKLVFNHLGAANYEEVLVRMNCQLHRVKPIRK